MDNQLLLQIFEKALLTRRFEERIRSLAMAGGIPSSLHEGAGQEISQIAAITALRDDDCILYGHRGLAYMVARGVDLSAMLADFSGKDGGTNRGKGGCMHIVDPEKGILGESGTVGGGFVISVGVGMALQRKQPGRIVVHFFGDGTATDFPCELHGCQRFFVRAGIFARCPDTDAGCRHQGRRALVGRFGRIGTEVEQRAHQRHIRRLGCQHEGRCADAIELIAVPVLRLDGRVCARARARPSHPCVQAPAD